MKLVHLVGFVIKKFVTMQHGHMNVKIKVCVVPPSFQVVAAITRLSLTAVVHVPHGNSESRLV